jgi:hypothetical protein
MTETIGAAVPKARKGAKLRLERLYTTEGTHPYDAVNWERRDVVMTNWRDGSINFEQRGVEFPDFWSVNAANIVTDQVLPRRRRPRQPRVEPQATHQPRGDEVQAGRYRLRVLRDP